jgi:Flp pilus assembly protein TadD
MNIAAPPSASSRSFVISQAVSHLQRNEVGAAGALLSDALTRSPYDPALLHLMGTARRLENRPTEAEELYRRSLKCPTPQPQVHRDLGKLLASQHRLDEAVAEFRQATRLRPNDQDAHLCLATALARQGRHAAAEASYREVLRLQPGQIVARLGLAEALCHCGRPQDAERVLRESAAPREPAQAGAFAHRLGVALKQQKKYSQALAQFDAAQSYQTDLPAVDYLRGETLQQMGRWEEAAKSFRKVLARRPDHANAAACLALISALAEDFAETREWSAKALARDSAHGIAHIALALAEIADGNYSGASGRLGELLEAPESAQAEGTAIAAGFAADAFDRHGRYHECFDVSRASKAMLGALWSPQAGSRRMVDVARELTNYFEASEPWPAGATPETDDEQPAEHVFVLGFLRSGTTLLETIMATDPKVLHADEIDFLADGARTFLMDTTGLERLAALSDHEIAAWRGNYWKSVRDAKFTIGGKIFVDKMPINTFRLPLIARLFPRAKIVFAVRDPRDVVLSCFRRHFDPTPYSLEFLQLEDCARFYAAAMSFAEACKQKLRLEMLELRYEELVADFDCTAGALCRFTGIDWNDAMHDFQTAAGSIDLRGASARQVRRGLYSGAAGHWRNYREELAPVLPILAPWVARFGYPPE